MATRHVLPDSEEREFQCNRYGTTVQAFGIVDDKTHRQSYGLVLSRGNKRTTLIGELPHSWEGVERVLDQLKPWLEGSDVDGDA